MVDNPSVLSSSELKDLMTRRIEKVRELRSAQTNIAELKSKLSELDAELIKVGVLNIQELHCW